MKKILCLGSATKDIFVRLKETRILDNPQEVQAQKLMAFEFGAKEYAEKLQEEVGGSAVNVAVGLTLLNQKAFLLSRVDRGEAGAWILKRASRKKIKKNYAQKSGQTAGEISVIISDQKNGDHIIFRSGDSTDNFDFEKFVDKFQEKADWILVASQKKAWLQKEKQILDFVQKRKVQLAFNPSSFQISQAQKHLANFLPKVDLLLLNKDEAIEILLKIKKEKVTWPQEILTGLLSLGVKNVALTDGSNGAYVADEKTSLFLPVEEKVSLAETVGAGDAFASGFLAAFCQTEALAQALTWGIANSTSAVRKIGGTVGLLTLAEIKRNAQKLEQKIEKIN